MGPSGVEGTFMKTAEHTLQVLQRNKDALLTILSAVVEDPLYKWSLTPVEVQQQEKYKAAEKAVATIKLKLQGYENATAGEQHRTLAQVEHLTKSARNPDNLSQMYPNWKPWI